LTLQP